MALSLFDRIEIAVAVSRGEAQFRREQAKFKREQRRDNRAAGNNKDNGDKPDSNTGNNATFESDKDKKNETVVNTESNPTVNAEPTGKETNANNVSATKPTPETHKKSAKTVSETPKTEQQINAEAEAPEEPAGSEKINTTAEAAVEEPVEAAMGGNVRVEDTPPNIMDLGCGVVIDLDKMCGNTSTPSNPFDQVSTQHPINPVADMMQFQVNPIASMDTYGNLINNQQNVNPVPVQYPQQMQNPINPIATPNTIIPPAPPVGYGHHKVDMPVPPKPQKGPKSKPDTVDMEGMPDITDGMEITDFKKFDARTVGVVEDKVSMDVEPIPPTSIFKNNNEVLYHDYPYLAEIEKLALEKGYQIGYAHRKNTNLVECHIYSNDGTPINEKGFVIDPGMIIDRRKKIFAGITPFYEGCNAYPLFINSGDNKNGKKSGNVLNVDILTGLIVGGNRTVDGVRGMYSEDFRNLNKFVALITIPTDKNSPADRKYIQNRLVELYKNGVFSEALATAPGARFRVIEYNKNSGAILLDTAGVTNYFGGQYIPNERIQLKITKDKCKVLRGENIIDIPENRK